MFRKMNKNLDSLKHDFWKTVGEFWTNLNRYLFEESL